MKPASSQSGPRPAAWTTCVLMTIAAFALLRATDTGLEIGGFLATAALVLTLVVVHLVYTWRRPDALISAATGGLAVLIWAGVVAGVTALAALRTGAPLIDSSLAHTDAVLGLDTPALVAWVARHPPLGMVLAIVYGSTVPMVFAAVLLLAATHREARMWQTCIVFAGSAGFCTLVSAFLPAIGAVIHYETPPEILAMLPAGAGGSTWRSSRRIIREICPRWTFATCKASSPSPRSTPSWRS